MNKFVTLIKILVGTLVIYEVCCSLSLISSLIQYSQVLGDIDSVTKLGSSLTLLASLAKVVAAISVHYYVSKRTERTPENKVHLSKLLWTVTFATSVVTLFLIMTTENHRENVTLQSVEKSTS